MKIKILIFFLIVNFGALGIGSWLMNNGPITEWYISLNKAPWTPPGWVFGLAWTTIMICFSIYMTYLHMFQNTIKLKILFTIQVVLNVSWNYVFFNRHFIVGGAIIIILLSFLILYFLITYQKNLKLKSFWIFPYFIWLCIATSLNLYIVQYN